MGCGNSAQAKIEIQEQEKQKRPYGDFKQKPKSSTKDKKDRQSSQTILIKLFQTDVKRNLSTQKEMIRLWQKQGSYKQIECKVNYTYLSINQFNQIAGRSQQELQNLLTYLNEPFGLMRLYFRNYSQLKQLMAYFLKTIQQDIEKGFSESDNSKFQELKQNSPTLLDLIYCCINAAKDSHKRQRSKIQEQSQNQELRLIVQRLKKSVKDLQVQKEQILLQKNLFEQKAFNMQNKLKKYEEDIYRQRKNNMQSQTETKQSQYKAQLTEKQKIINIQGEKIKNLEEKMKSYQSELQTFSQNTKQVETLQSPNKILQNHIKLNEQQIKQLKNKNIELNTQLQNHIHKTQQRQNKLQTLKQENKRLNQIIQKKNTEHENLQILLQRQKNTHQSIKQSLDKEILKLKQKMNVFQKEHQMKRTQDGQQKQKQNKIIQLSKVLTDKQKQIKDMKMKILKSEQNQKEHELQIEKIISTLNQSVKQEKKKVGRKQQQLQRKQYQLQDVKKLNIQLSQKLQQYKNSPGIGGFRKSFVEHKTLFVGDVLEQFKFQKHFLVQAIQQHMRKDIIKTKILYQFKQDKKINFHQRIDNHHNLTVIIQTVNGMLLAGYYSDQYAEKKVMTSEGLIMSLTNTRAFALNTIKNNPKKDKENTKNMLGMVYDKYFLIYGNSEIRIKTGQKKLFSNFGISNAYFFSQGETVNMLLGQGKKNEVQIANYQIHQVFFSNE